MIFKLEFLNRFSLPVSFFIFPALDKRPEIIFLYSFMQKITTLGDSIYGIRAN